MKQPDPVSALTVLREELREIATESLALGLAMLLVSLYTLHCSDQPLLLTLLPWLPAWTLLFLAAAFLLVWHHHLPPEENSSFVGMAVPYTLQALWAVALFVCAFTSFSLLLVLVFSALTAVLFWLADFLLLRRAASQMNKTNRPLRMTITYDLEERPCSDEAFFRVLEQRCMEEHSSLEYVTRAQPALVRLDGVLCEVKVQTYYTKYGLPAYELKVTEMQ